MKRIIFIISMLIINSFLYSQDYPRIETDSSGHKIVIFSIEQAHKLDTDEDVLILLKQFRIKCDSLDLSYIKVINEQSKQIILLKEINDQLKKENIERDQQIQDICEVEANLEQNIQIGDIQRKNDQDEINKLKVDVKKTKWKSLGGGFVIGVVVTIVTILLIP